MVAFTIFRGGKGKAVGRFARKPLPSKKPPEFQLTGTAQLEFSSPPE